jgi:hypothetical protein
VRIVERDYSAEERRELAGQGQAMPDGSFPIVDGEDLEDAIHLAAHASDPAEARAFIRRRARELGLADRLPDSWS